MSQFRRQGDRRRRVLMTSASAIAAANHTPGSRSRIESLREARRPTLVYGTRVRAGLRGRWFSLVPVDRSALAKLLAVVSAIVLAIVLMNDATVRFQSIESQSAFVNVFQIIRPGSLGRYVIGVMYLIVAGAAWMVYQLRRFRNDDFRGNYRLWQWIVAASLVASIASLVPLTAMFGAGIEMLMGRRIALSGHDWIGLFLVVGGAILALRTVAEMWRYRASLMMLMGGWFCVAMPVAAQWNVVAVNTNMRWSIVTAAPLLAVTLWFAATVSYLRSLYREVRGIERSTGFLQRLRDATPRPFFRGDSSEPSDTSREYEPSPTRKTVAAKLNNPARVRPAAAASESVEAEKTTVKRRWFGLLPPAKPRAAATNTNGSETESRCEKTPPGNAKRKVATANDDRDERVSDNDDASDESDDAIETTPKRRWWPSLRSRSKATSEAAATADDVEKESPAKEAGAQESERKKRRFGLGSMMKRNRGAQADDDDADEQDRKTTSSNRSDADSNATAKGRPDADLDEDDDEERDEENDSDDDIDWSSMNKAERRRMRKQLKRGGKAA